MNVLNLEYNYTLSHQLNFDDLNICSQNVKKKRHEKPKNYVTTIFEF